MPLRSNREEFIKKAQPLYNNKYDYSKVEYVNNKTKVCIICPEHGEFFVKPDNHLTGRNGCPKCSGNKRFTTEEFIEKAKSVHGDKYDYSKVNYINSQTKIEIICPKHGSFWQIPNAHINQEQGCPACSKRFLDYDRFVGLARLIHGDKYDYSKVIIDDGYNSNVIIICPKHGEFVQRASHHIEGTGCKKCKVTKNEQRIADFLNKNKIEFYYNRACLDFLSGMKPDFYLPVYNTVIEYDGEYHFKKINWSGKLSEEQMEKSLSEVINRDKLKDRLCKENGVNIIRISFGEADNIESILTDKLLREKQRG